MMDVLHVAHEIEEAGSDDTRVCPECLKAFLSTQETQIFCQPEHRHAWDNRWTARGRKAMMLVAAARLTRSGTRNAGHFTDRASRDADCLLRRWVREDRAEDRMSLVEYIDLRYRYGFDPI